MKSLLATALLLAPLAACATITRGTTEAFTVETEPGGATVESSIGLTCAATPCTFARVPRESEFTVTISKPGYRTTTHNVTHTTATGGGAAMAGNVLVGGIIGAAIDGNNGATQDLTPNPLRVVMERETISAAADVAAPAEAAAPAAEPAATAIDASAVADPPADAAAASTAPAN